MSGEVVAEMKGAKPRPRRRYLVENWWPSRPRVDLIFDGGDMRHDFHTLFFARRRMRWYASQGYDAQVVDTRANAQGVATS